MTGGIFISYRRNDARWAAGRIADALEPVFGAGSIFRDIDRIDPGSDFVHELERSLASCAVMLVLIGPQWASAADAAGQRRLDDPQDWIRLEVATALARNIRVIPVLVDGAGMPSVFDLPTELQPLLRKQAMSLSDGRFDQDMTLLIDTLRKDPLLAAVHERVSGARTVPRLAARTAPRWPLFAGGAVAASAGVVILLEYLPLGEAPVVAATPLSPAEMLIHEPTATGNTETASQAALPARDVSGPWRSNNGETYVFHQEGANVRIEVSLGDAPIGHGSGTLNGNTLVATLSLPVGNAEMSSHCSLQAAPNGQSLLGICENAGGSFPAQLYR